MIRRRWLGPGILGVFATVAAVQACGGEEDRPPLAGPPSGGVGGHAGVVGTGGAGAASGGNGATAGSSGDGGPQDPLLPVVTLQTPGELAHPNDATADNAVLVKDTVTAVCRVEMSTQPGARDVDGTSIKIELIEADGKIVSGTVTSTEAHLYSANFPLKDVATGPVRFRCSASDISDPPKSNEDVNATFVDHGPKIRIIQPMSGAAKRRESVAFEYAVDAVPLADGDTGAAVGPVELTVFGKSVEIALSNGIYRGEANFADATKFGTSINGAVTVSFKASNTRSPEAGVATEEYPISVDGDPPLINITSPPNNYFVVGGKRVTIRFEVTDPVSKVNKAKVSVKVHTLEAKSFEDMKPDIWTEENGKFTYTFDSQLIPNTNTQINVNVRAEDNAANFSDQGLILSLDNEPPIVDLYPGNVRELKRNTTTCSESFDPLGTVPEDGDTIGAKVRIRALVWDDTNHELEPLPNTTDYYARADTASVHVYLQRDPNTALLIDADKNGSCDSLVVTAQGQDLTGFAAAGDPAFGNATSTDPPPLSNCTEGPARPPSNVVCNGLADLKRVIEHTMIVSNGGENVVYGIGGGGASDCVGGTWDIPSLVPEGWVCVAALAKDRVGNLGISRPLRLCVDRPENGPNPCDEAQKPPCTDGCRLPRHFDAQIIGRRP